MNDLAALSEGDPFLEELIRICSMPIEELRASCGGSHTRQDADGITMVTDWGGGRYSSITWAWPAERTELETGE